ncbi:PilW family protein [Variovorax sp. YR216]|uniref:PilW family protein n=1 Tax=Variovorax sp. YR216 TaxID=1882828 RepID=UPI000898FE19|nr:PilW family protein [Variovorax sp. YR216]SEB14199.1 type IV pilus assembly protein PilW [Variovorax sp. YR216]
MRMHKRSRPPRYSGGFTLVELMVAMTLGLFLMIGLISLIVTTVTSRSELDKASRKIENGRYAIELLTNDIELAGFIGQTAGSSYNFALPVTCPLTMANLGYTAVARPGISTIPLQLYNVSTTPTCISNVMANTAMLIVTRVSTTAVTPANVAAAETYLQVSTCATDTQPFVIASGASASSFNLMTKDCVSSKLAPVRKVVQHLYFVSTCNVCGTDTTPTLKMAEYVNGAITVTPLVEGIENLQLDYGVDLDGNGSPDCYTSNPANPPIDEATKQPVAEVAAAVCSTTAATPVYDWSVPSTNWGNVMSVRVHVLARNTESSPGWKDTRTYNMGLAFPTLGPFKDQIKRHVYSTVVRLNNAAGQREIP